MALLMMMVPHVLLQSSLPQVALFASCCFGGPLLPRTGHASAAEALYALLHLLDTRKQASPKRSCGQLDKR